MNDTAGAQSGSASRDRGPGWVRLAERFWEGSFLAPLLPRMRLDPEILARKVASVYERLLPAMILNLFMGLIFFFFLDGSGGHLKAQLWLLAVALLVLGRYLDIRAYRREPDGQGGVRRIRIGAVLQGGLWAYAALALLPHTVTGTLIGALVLVGISGAVVIFQSPIWSAYCLYATCMMLPASLAMLARDDHGLRTLGALGLIYILVMAYASGSASRRLEDLLLAARDNAELFEQSRQEEELRQAQKLESLGVLAGGVAHDFNNLLGAVMGNLNLLQLQTPPGTANAAHLSTMEAAVERAAGLTRQMLAFSGGGAFVIQDLDLDQVILHAQGLVNRCVAKQIVLSLDLAAEGCSIAADLGQIQQLLSTLLTNASEAIHGKPGEIWIRTRRVALDPDQAARAGAILPLLPGDHVQLVLADSGEGMAEEVLERIFDPFFTTRESGRGLGLSAVLGILRSHSAGIAVQSRPGAGSTFNIYFPLSNRTALKEAPQSHPSGQPFTGRVLLVDDEPTLLETAQAMLEGMGLRVDTARDGLEALERFQADPEGIGLVILDLTMPRMDGHQAFQALRSLKPNLPVIISSGYNAQNTAELLQGPGPSAFLHKPYTMRDLKKVVDATVG